MNAGLGNLDTLKKYLLATSLQSDTRFDSVIAMIGIGVAGMMERFCDRKFARMVADQAICMADRSSFLLPRYPVEQITAVETKLKDSDGWTAADMTTLIQSTSPTAGIIYLADQADAGPYWGQVRFTYTGGYWFETAEPEDDTYYPGQMPAGATLLPEDLKMAWLLQCEQIWQIRDKLGTGITGAGAEGQFLNTKMSTLELVPLVKDMLLTYRRLQLV